MKPSPNIQKYHSKYMFTNLYEAFLHEMFTNLYEAKSKHTKIPQQVYHVTCKRGIIHSHIIGGVGYEIADLFIRV
jgi:hypothetical protein